MNKDEWNEDLEIISRSLEYKYKSNILIYSLNNESSEIKKIANIMNNSKKQEKYFLLNKLSQFANSNKVIVIVTLNQTKKESLLEFKRKFSNLNMEVISLFIITNKNNQNELIEN